MFVKFKLTSLVKGAATIKIATKGLSDNLILAENKNATANKSEKTENNKYKTWRHLVGQKGANKCIHTMQKQMIPRITNK